jgi:UDP-N-acetylglucosamine--N-acetylmuramyl-(pentapeptide) pyrophosphoryl-undecaprenol N-acetylglucosamine transferase
MLRVGTQVGYYVHHHGGGHAARANAIADQMRTPVTVLTSAQVDFECEVKRLPMDTDGPALRSECPPELHFAPFGSRGLSQRMSMIAEWIASARPSLFVVDVSVEVALLARLCGVPVTIVRQHGNRNDPAHRLAINWARHLLAPYPEWFEEPTTTEEVRARTSYAGAVSRFDGGSRPKIKLAEQPTALLVSGGDRRIAALTAPISAVGWRADLAGNADDRKPFPIDRLAAADVVVGAGGSNLVAEAAFAGRGLVVFPRDRPFGEQLSRGTLLDALGMAEVCWEHPRDGCWRGLLDSAIGKREALSRLADGGGAARAAELVDRWAAASHRSAEAGTASRTPSPGSHRTRPSRASRASHPGAGHSPHFAW